VNLLLDTHVVLWWRLDSSRLTRSVRQHIATANVVWVSAASGWEVAIKQGLGKLRLADSFQWMVEDSDFDELPVTLRHAEHVVTLPAHHTDPFDRMLIAQARVERAAIVTHDPQFERYDVPVVRV
jgi:PIN domain nuclease of toxin-antitoxin system